MNRQLFCTIGPASTDPRILVRLAELGVSLFRINLSHTKLADLPSVIESMRQHTDVPICLDTEGAQIRTGDLLDDVVEVRENDVLIVSRSIVPGNARRINLYPLEIVKSLQDGDFVSIDFNTVLAQVVRSGPAEAHLRILNGGRMGKNKAVTVERPIQMSPLTEKDIGALAIGREMGIRNVALSFANSGEDVQFIRTHVSEETRVISKIECRNGIHNLDEIARLSDSILIDRGDLSREYPVEQIPALQKRIIKQSKSAGCEVFVATNLLESMVKDPFPTRAEVNDVYNTLLDGADGLVLAAETAIGNHPVACASMIVRLVKTCESNIERENEEDVKFEPASLLVEPHGGALINRVAEDQPANPDANEIVVPETVLIDSEQVAVGTYSPLSGFMDRETLESVLAENRLPNGTVWTMPVPLQIPSDCGFAIDAGGQLALKSDAGTIHAYVDVTQVWEADPLGYAKDWFGTDDMAHPGVARFVEGGNRFVAGPVTLIERLPSPYRHFQLSPAQTRFIFGRKGWIRVVGFHTRNVAHRVHEHIQLKALERANADGLYISPVSGPRKTGDFLPGPILDSYQLLLDFRFYPAGKILLGSFASYPRYAGPREAVFTALCRKNMGCSHFVIGRDHTGVGNFYGPDDNRKLFEQLDDLGIEPVFFEAIGYNANAAEYTETANASEIKQISGTEAREALQSGKPLPDWYMRDVIQHYLRNELQAGNALFMK
ncbi:MAG: sulfate adenylyltransferase [Rhodospirillaceae bacterium]|nr:sulfate adenylyltransferase [Rhodospirillaceae bacterium]